MTRTIQEYGSPPSYDSSNMFSSTSRNISSDNGFFEAFGNAQTNKVNSSARPHERSHSGNLNLNSNTDASFFDFDPPSRTSSPFQTQISTHSPTGNMTGWGSEMTFHPLSPPRSASAEPKGWEYGFPAYPAPSNILTNIDTPNARAQFGQVTPPDDDRDEAESILDRQLREQLQAETRTDESAAQQPEPAAGKKRTRGSTKENGPAKRTRKSHAKNSGSANGAPSNKPEDVRRSKFLERNRVAASKCRQKKKEWTQNLETRARDMQKANASLRMIVDSLRQEVTFLRGEILRHNECDCSAIQKFIKTAGHRLSEQGEPESVHAARLFKKESSPLGGSPLSSGTQEEGQSPDRSEVEGEDDFPSFRDEQNKADLAEDESALEALLTSSLNQNTSEQGIAVRVNA